jgi:Asp-tRNA(Asn)/Glu-tRNA(Gln) amidotransferase A subunit family amidase
VKTDGFSALSHAKWQNTFAHCLDTEIFSFWQPLSERHQDMANDPTWRLKWEKGFDDYIRRFDPLCKAFADWRPVSLSPKNGVMPFLVTYKDNIDIAGFPTKYGSSGGFRSYPIQSAHIAEKLHQKNFLCIGKVATTEFGVGNQFNCVNPLFPAFSPSGSSTGSAVAVAAGFCDLSIGTDTAGSIRFPAGNCGVVALRLTNQPAFKEGIFPVSPSMDSIGLIARTVADLSYIWHREKLNELGESAPEQHLSGSSLKIGIVQNFRDAEEHCHPEICEAFAQLEQLLGQAGHTLEPVELEWWHYREIAWFLLLKEIYDVHSTLAEKIAIKYEAGTRASFMSGEHITDKDYRELRSLQETAKKLASRDLREGKYDVLLLPLDSDLPRNLIQPPPAQTIPSYGNVQARDLGFTNLASFVGIPALTLPIAIAPSGAPISIQLFAAQREEEKLIRAGLLIENLVNLL